MIHKLDKAITWSQIELLLSKSKNEAYKLALQGNPNNETQMVNVVRLMGRTGVCIDLLEDSTITRILDWSMRVLLQREFIDVLLPWVC